MKSLIIHGRQPAIGRAELESLYGSDLIRPAGAIATLLDIEPVNINFMQLGGMVKFCKVLTTIESTDWDEIEKFLINAFPTHVTALPEGKLKIGLSCYGIKASPRRIHATALELKKAGKQSGRSVRVIPNKEAALSSAQVLHNKLTQKLGWELIFVKDKDKTIVGQSIAVQDIEAYSRRDRDRPSRDTRVGMLPPKLAQNIINLATGSPAKIEAKTTHPPVVLDPFCGTGVILQEALLMGYHAIGTDIENRMVQFSKSNVDWLAETHNYSGFLRYLDAGDATSHQWFEIDNVDAVACETYLGRPFSQSPDHKTLQKVINDCTVIHRKFLANLAPQIASGFRMCLAVPAWKSGNGFERLPTLDHLEKLGYNRLSFAHAKDVDLIYHRPGQYVARELVVLEKK